MKRRRSAASLGSGSRVVIEVSVGLIGPPSRKRKARDRSRAFRRIRFVCVTIVGHGPRHCPAAGRKSFGGPTSIASSHYSIVERDRARRPPPEFRAPDRPPTAAPG